jgi:hypothetical protein
VTGQPRIWLRLEGLAALAAAIVGYRVMGGSWGFLAVLFLAPDLTFLGFLAGTGVGARVYNAAHTYVGPAALAAVAAVGGVSSLYLIALIWTAHIGFDRVLGYGLKYPSAFTDTHLGSKGHAVGVDGKGKE